VVAVVVVAVVVVEGGSGGKESLGKKESLLDGSPFRRSARALSFN